MVGFYSNLSFWNHLQEEGKTNKDDSVVDLIKAAFKAIACNADKPDPDAFQSHYQQSKAIESCIHGNELEIGECLDIAIDVAHAGCITVCGGQSTETGLTMHSTYKTGDFTENEKRL